MAGLFFVASQGMLPFDLRPELFRLLSAEIARQVKAAGSAEREILEDFDAWRKRRRAHCRR